jgi:hypothetical protein
MLKLNSVLVLIIIINNINIIGKLNTNTNNTTSTTPPSQSSPPSGIYYSPKSPTSPYTQLTHPFKTIYYSVNITLVRNSILNEDVDAIRKCFLELGFDMFFCSIVCPTNAELECNKSDAYAIMSYADRFVCFFYAGFGLILE